MKTTLYLLLVLCIIGGCVENKETSDSTEKGAIKVTIMYPNGVDKIFDMDYYSGRHMPMLAQLFGDKMKKYEIDKGLSGRTPEDEIPYLAIGYLYFGKLSDYQEAFGPNAETILSDIPNYTNIQPLVQISQVIDTP